MRSFVIAAAAALLVSGCMADDEKVRADLGGSMAPYRATAYASSSIQPGRTAAQKQLMAIRAAKAAAMRELAEKIYGADIGGTTSVVEGRVYSDTLRSGVDGLVRGARTVSLTPIRKDVYEAVMEVDAWEVAAMRRAQRPASR